MAANPPGPALGSGAGVAHPAEWIVVRRALDDGLELLVAAPTRGGEALRVFGWSLLLAMPLCLAVALLIGRFVGRRATQPLVELKTRITGARPFQPLPRAELAGAPLEVRQLDEAFQALWRGLDEALARELEFAANASHELRTPLTRIRLYAERARSEATPLAKAQLEQLTAEVDRMVRLVESLLVLARDASAGIPGSEVVNLADTARAALVRVLGSGRGDACDLPDEALVRGDEELLAIAVENLFDNADKFGAPGQPVSVTLCAGDGHVSLRVTSPGARVAEARLIFERFYRSPEARAVQPGHGLGLPLARHIARLHDGDVSCVSSPDEDAAFELRLPAWTTRPTEPGRRGAAPR